MWISHLYVFENVISQKNQKALFGVIILNGYWTNAEFIRIIHTYSQVVIDWRLEWQHFDNNSTVVIPDFNKKNCTQ